METVQQIGRFTLFSSKFPSNIYSILYVYTSWVVMYPLIPHDVPCYSSWCSLLFLMMYPLIPHDVPSYSSCCTLLFLVMYPLISHDVPSYSSWCTLLFLMMYPLICFQNFLTTFFYILFVPQYQIYISVTFRILWALSHLN